MSHRLLTLILAATLASAGCGYSSHNYMNGTGMPVVSALSPSSALAGGSDFTLTVTGTGFGADALVYWGTTPMTTSYVSSTQVTAAISSAEIMAPATVQVYVHTSGANSNVKTFTIQ